MFCFNTISGLVPATPVNDGPVEEVSYKIIHWLFPETWLNNVWQLWHERDSVLCIQATKVYENDLQDKQNSKQKKSKKLRSKVQKSQFHSVYENIDVKPGKSDVIYGNIWSNHQDSWDSDKSTGLKWPAYFLHHKDI